MSTMVTRIGNGHVVASVEGGTFTVRTFLCGEEIGDVYSTTNEAGNYSKVLCLNEAMRPLLTYLGVNDEDFPF